MPRPSIPIDQFKEDIRRWVFDDSYTAEKVADLVSLRLGQPCTPRTIKGLFRKRIEPRYTRYRRSISKLRNTTLELNIKRY
jgi:hypothetical protein